MKAADKWVAYRKAKIHKGVCLHTGCKKKHVDGNRCCKTHAAFYRERNRKYNERKAKGLVGK